MIYTSAKWYSFSCEYLLDFRNISMFLMLVMIIKVKAHENGI